MRFRSCAAMPRVSLTGPALALLIAGLSISQAQAQEHAGLYEQTDIEYGSRLYSQHCITCHGPDGNLQPAVNLRTGRFPNAPTDYELQTVLREGIPGTAMVATAYNDSEITALIAYLRNMANVDLGTLELGDASRGRALFEGKGECGSCHRVNGIGPRFAPDLSNIAALRTPAMLENALLGGEGSVAAISLPVRAVTADGTVINGRRLNEDTFSVQLIDEQEDLVSLDKSELRELTVLTTPTMPSYADSLSNTERADLLAYLLSLNGQMP